VLAGFGGYGLLLTYLWTNYGLIVKTTPIGSLVPLVMMFYMFASWTIPLKYAEEYPDQLLKAERVFLPLFVGTYVAYSAGIFFASKWALYVIAGLGPVWFVSLSTCWWIFGGYYFRALARMRLVGNKLAMTEQVSLDTREALKGALRLFRAALNLYNRHLTSLYGFRIRNVERFCKPFIVASLSRSESGNRLGVGVDCLISSIKLGPVEFLQSARAMAREPAEGVEAMYDDIEMESDYVRILTRYLPPAVTVIATVAGAAATIYGLLIH
jgi:hypothetical protein